ncbi:MAG: hypothetical protein [Bacteriophage sp.]|nr:MAG: hypothetical protein [Bacteriophage sp.]
MLFESNFSDIEKQSQTLLERLLDDTSPETKQKLINEDIDFKLIRETFKNVDLREFPELKENLDLLETEFKDLNLDIKKFNLFKDSKNLNESSVFKKSKELLRCETLLQEMIDVISNYDNITGDELAKNVERYKEVEQILEKYFNFRKLFLSIPTLLGFPSAIIDAESKEQYKKKTGKDLPPIMLDPSMLLVPNAFTIVNDPVSILRKVFKNEDDVFIKTDNKIAFNEDYKPIGYIAVTLPLMSGVQVTGAEILAIILHEIGHNMYYGSIISRAMKVINIYMGFMSTLILLVNHIVATTTLSILIQNELGKLILKYLALFSFFIGDVVSVITGNPSSRVESIFGKEFSDQVRLAGNANKLANLAVTLFLIFGQYGANVIKFLFSKLFSVQNLLTYISMDGLGEETFCDQFAAAHGYGPELSSGLSKLSGVIEEEKIFVRGDGKVDSKKEATQGSVMAYFNAKVNLIFNLMTFDPHPDTISRPYLIVDFYKDQLKKAKSKEERKFIEEQIVLCIKESSKYKVSSDSERQKILEKEMLIDDKNNLKKTMENKTFVQTILGTLSNNGYNMDALDASLTPQTN